MAKMTGKQGLKICEVLQREVGQAAADDFAEKHPLSSSADYIRKFKWANGVCGYFDANFSPEEVRRLRMACSCNPPEGKLRDAKTIYDAASMPEDFCEGFNRKFAPDNSVWHEGGAYYFSYPRCYCSCVARVNEPLPRTWCFCTLGYVKKLFDYVLCLDTQVELLESVKLGSSRCVMKINYTNL